MPLPLTVSCFSEIQIGFTFLVPAHPGSPGKRAVKRVCVCSTEREKGTNRRMDWPLAVSAQTLVVRWPSSPGDLACPYARRCARSDCLCCNTFNNIQQSNDTRTLTTLSQSIDYRLEKCLIYSKPDRTGIRRAKVEYNIIKSHATLTAVDRPQPGYT